MTSKLKVKEACLEESNQTNNDWKIRVFRKYICGRDLIKILFFFLSEIYIDVFIFHTQEWSLSLQSLFSLLEWSLALFCCYNKISVTFFFFFYCQGLIERLILHTQEWSLSFAKILCGQILIVVGTYVRDKGLISHWRRGISFLSLVWVCIQVFWRSFSPPCSIMSSFFFLTNVIHSNIYFLWTPS